MSIEIDTGRLNEHVARLVSETSEFAAVADEVQTVAKAIAAADSDSGDFAESIKVKKITTKKGITDYLIYSDHPNALSIEYGHLAGKHGKPGREFVPGNHAFTKAVKKVKRS